MSWCEYVLYGFKRHYIDASLAAPLKEMLRVQARELHYEIKEKEEEATRVYFEPGGYGMYAMNQPRMTLELGEKKLEIDCAKATELLFDLLASQKKDLPNGTRIFRCHSRLSCLCLTAEERESLIAQLRLNIDSANERADAFKERSEAAWQADKSKYEAKHGEGSWPIVRSEDLPRKELPN